MDEITKDLYLDWIIMGEWYLNQSYSFQTRFSFRIFWYIVFFCRSPKIFVHSMPWRTLNESLFTYFYPKNKHFPDHFWPKRKLIEPKGNLFSQVAGWRGLVQWKMMKKCQRNWIQQHWVPANFGDPFTVTHGPKNEMLNPAAFV